MRRIVLLITVVALVVVVMLASSLSAGARKRAPAPAPAPAPEPTDGDGAEYYSPPPEAYYDPVTGEPIYRDAMCRSEAEARALGWIP